MNERTERTNEWQLVELTNHESITFNSNQKHVLFLYNSIFKWFYWAQAYQFWNVFSELWFTFFVSIQHISSRKKRTDYILITIFAIFTMLWIIVELFTLFPHTFAKVNEPMQLYLQSLCKTMHNSRFLCSPFDFKCTDWKLVNCSMKM